MTSPRAVLISALRLQGDVILSTPLIDMVRSEHPDCAIDFLVPKGMGSVLRADPRLRRVIEQDRGSPAYLGRIALRYDWAFSTNGSDRSILALLLAGRRRRIALTDGSTAVRHWWRHAALTHAVPIARGKPVVTNAVALARAAGLNPTRCRVQLHDAPEDTQVVAAFLAAHRLEPGRFVVMHMLSRQPFKEWAAERLAAASDALHDRHGLRTVWTGSPSATDRAKLLAARQAARHQPTISAGDLSLSSMHALLRLARLYVGVDTAITHIAAAAGVPMVALYGPTPTYYWAPWSNDWPIDHAFPAEPGSFRDGPISVIQDADTFRQEHRFGQMRMDLPSRGMAAITVDQVMAEVHHLLSRPSVHSPA